MCLSAFPCTWTSCSSSRMHALCAVVTTSFCPRTLRSECCRLSPSAALRSSCLKDDRVHTCVHTEFPVFLILNSQVFRVRNINHGRHGPSMQYVLLTG
jgi:hypothetical protein